MFWHESCNGVTYSWYTIETRRHKVYLDLLYQMTRKLNISTISHSEENTASFGWETTIAKTWHHNRENMDPYVGLFITFNLKGWEDQSKGSAQTLDHHCFLLKHALSARTGNQIQNPQGWDEMRQFLMWSQSINKIYNIKFPISCSP